MEEKKIINKWLNHEQLTEGEFNFLKELDAYDSYVKISETSKKIELPSFEVQPELTELLDVISERKTKSTNTSVFSNLLKVAAVFVIGITSYFLLFYTSDTTIETLASQKVAVTLPDQSEVRLNAFSSIVYSEKDWGDKRKITLDGEAYFKVAKGKKFDVVTTFGVVTVMGTEFNVNQRNDFLEVVCYEGHVQVAYKSESEDLRAGTRFMMLNGRPRIESISKIQPDWIDDRSTFVSMPYGYILEEFERQYDVTIIDKNIDKTILFTGNFVHSDIQTALQSIVIPMGLNYKLDGRRITLFKE